MVPMGDSINRMLTTYLHQTVTNSHNLVNKSINILSKQLCFSNSTNQKIFLGSNTVVNMAANMAVRSIYSLEPLRQHCKGFSALQSCPRNIKTTLHRIFPFAKLSGASRTTLYNVVWSFLDNTKMSM